MKSDRVYLLHMRDALERINQYTRNGKDAFFADTRTQDAIVRNFEIRARPPSAYLPRHEPQLRTFWRVVAGMRDKLIHEYFGVNLALVW